MSLSEFKERLTFEKMNPVLTFLTSVRKQSAVKHKKADTSLKDLIR